ncbi:MAG: nickel-dependent hydrogenase large subunit [Elusimicrobia bacterium]|nr:nickel-dependent hydrogenase large subunit [Elusimicrobiota bacterium]
MRARTIRIEPLARVEGEGSILVEVRGGRVARVHLGIFEPPRLFEAFLRGKGFAEVPDITARICGICPVAYQMSATRALESDFGVELPAELRELRRLLYCGEWLESHALHVFLLHAPDFLGRRDAFELARDRRELVVSGLRLKKLGNAIVALLGGRAIHPVSVRVGGFHGLPEADQVRALAGELDWGRGAALAALRWAAGLEFPDFEVDYEFVSLRHGREYPLNEGRLVSNRGLDIDPAGFNGEFEELQVGYSTALRGARRGRGPCLVGPLARFNNNFDLLPEPVRRACRGVGLAPPVRNPFKSIAVRCAEMLFACAEAARIARAWSPPPRAGVAVRPRAGEGHGCTEAPRGILYHRYRTDAAGRILEVQIVPPTALNLRRMEDDLAALVQRDLGAGRERLTRLCEQAVRNYDPCISCATHDLRVLWKGLDGGVLEK